MPRSSILLVLVTLSFAALSTIALLDAGYVGIIRPHFQSWAGAQVFADLVILAVMVCVWMRRDAAARGISPWPFILITLFLGSFGPLLYLLRREHHRAIANLKPA